MAATGENTVRPSCLRPVPEVLTVIEGDLGLTVVIIGEWYGDVATSVTRSSVRVGTIFDVLQCPHGAPALAFCARREAENAGLVWTLEALVDLMGT